ncbi:hypothetical protein CXF83_06345 [Shewanella sp. Choline-02u-19]|uniref:hypothetical protein n=1 Tax=unclassified Shewanella TaxID=196818 RepID=UPI000C328B8F|nr:MULTISPECIES: hypothetical protein [unclassified Shewanella]PKH56705.1 hypothetical protein CXF84_12365 [Shewanella sp. Bg11-22]PKI30256.1 hypothetical protein CXF83_06345 [Shewanella sp. Choline-02u-19]
MAKKVLIPITLLCCMLLTLTSAAAATPAVGTHHGQVDMIDGQAMAWEQTSQQWLTIEVFWQNWVNTRGGLTWKSSEQYPSYEQVKEQDTFLVELNGGTCMMEFWHGRWRRANDVRRWDDAFNDYSACPRVFD